MINYLLRIIASRGTVSLLASKVGKQCCTHGVHFLDSWQIHCILIKRPHPVKAGDSTTCTPALIDPELAVVLKGKKSAPQVPRE